MPLTGWGEFALAWLVFMLSHFLPSLVLRHRLIARIGRRAYFSAYGAASVMVLVWLVVATSRAPHVELWPPEPWTRWVPLLTMPLAVGLALCAVGNSYPFTLGGKRARPFDPLSPGLATLSRHPLALALALWSGSHLLPNGDLAQVLLFGSFATLSLLALPLFDARARDALPPDQVATLFRAAPILSLKPLFDPAWRHANRRVLLLRLISTALVVFGIVALHEAAVGVSPFP